MPHADMPLVIGLCPHAGGSLAFSSHSLRRSNNKSIKVLQRMGEAYHHREKQVSSMAPTVEGACVLYRHYTAAGAITGPRCSLSNSALEENRVVFPS